MCDNIVALGSVTKDGAVLFGKNSDREPNEPHIVTMVPRTQHAKGNVVRCTYVEIPQVTETNKIMLCKPSWMWGAEMGTNEHGLTIGNTAVFTREKYDTRPGLIGMDFLRLALERASTAETAVETITTLLETYGQSGNNGFAHELYYHNSFLIVDPQEAWVLETSGAQWVAMKVRDFAGTSNTLTITTEWDLASDGLIDYAHQQGWANKKGDFNVKESYGGSGLSASKIYDVFGHGDERHHRLTCILEENKGQITEELMMQALRDHGADDDAHYSPAKGLNKNPACMHAAVGPIRGGQTTGSLVSHLTKEVQTHWVTATAAPCTSTFKPVWLDVELPNMGEFPTGHYNHSSLWWRHERLHRSTLRDYPTMMAIYKEERDALEARFLEEARKLAIDPIDTRADFVANSFAEAEAALDAWTKTVEATEAQHKTPKRYLKAWQKLTVQSGYNNGYRKDFTGSPAG